MTNDLTAAVAEIVMENQTVNGPQDNGTADLDLDDLSVTVEFIWDRTDTRDAIIVTPPTVWSAGRPLASWSWRRRTLAPSTSTDGRGCD